jgi:translation initiation factor IF-3
VIDAEGKQLGILSTQDAIKEALRAGLDLVEVAPNSAPPVCRIMDYGKFRYQQSKKMQVAKKHAISVQLKEIRLRPRTEEHDLQTKIKHIKKFLEQNNKVKISMMFRGREIVYTDLGKAVMEEIKTELEPVCSVDQQPRIEGRNMVMILTPKK